VLPFCAVSEAMGKAAINAARMKILFIWMLRRTANLTMFKGFTLKIGKQAAYQDGQKTLSRRNN
jgi:hypothetical protein